MIQINLLPDVKSNYIKAQRSKRLIIISAVLVSAVAVGLLAIVGGIYATQKLVLSQLDSSIDKNIKTLQTTADLDKVLTIQNQLGALDKLHGDKPVSSRLLDILMRTTPNEVQVSSVSLNFADSTIAVNGTATNLLAVNKYVDTLKFAKYTTDSAPDQQTKAFSSVVLSSFNSADDEATYAITFKFDPAIFSGTNTSVNFIVDSMVTTRSETERPKELFKAQDTTEGQ